MYAVQNFKTKKALKAAVAETGGFGRCFAAFFDLSLQLFDCLLALCDLIGKLTLICPFALEQTL